VKYYDFVAIYWGTYEGIKKLFGHQTDPSLTFSFLAGATAGSVSVNIPNWHGFELKLLLNFKSNDDLELTVCRSLGLLHCHLMS
jgi:hypothetical protein